MPSQDQAGAEAVVFDLDGTLLDTMTVVPRVYVQTIRELGGPDLTPQELVAAWHMGPTPVVLAHFTGRAITSRDLDLFFDRMAAGAALTQPFPGVLDLLRALGEDGYALAVYTSATRRLIDATLARTGLGPLVSVVVTGDEVARPKPAPDGLLDTCRLLGVPATAAAYVGDAETDLQCAAAAGAIPVHARWSPHTVAVAGPGYAARQPGDVRTLLAGLGPGDGRAAAG
ncbi:MAG TPA: HAD family hydrolase [Streptosporangiaceae bacterium]|nr:HAD family hydrolase [Streptosporangiaceae bacterium]